MSLPDEERKIDKEMREFGKVNLGLSIMAGIMGVYRPWIDAIRHRDEITFWPACVTITVACAIMGGVSIIAGRRSRYLFFCRQDDASWLTALVTGSLILLGAVAEFYFKYFIRYHYGYEF